MRWLRRRRCHRCGSHCSELAAAAVPLRTARPPRDAGLPRSHSRGSHVLPCTPWPSRGLHQTSDPPSRSPHIERQPVESVVWAPTWGPPPLTLPTKYTRSLTAGQHLPCVQPGNLTSLGYAVIVLSGLGGTGGAPSLAPTQKTGCRPSTQPSNAVPFGPEQRPPGLCHPVPVTLRAPRCAPTGTPRAQSCVPLQVTGRRKADL